MRLAVVLIVLTLAACSEPRREVSLEIETARESAGPFARTESVETRTDVDRDTADALKEELVTDN